MDYDTQFFTELTAASRAATNSTPAKCGYCFHLGGDNRCHRIAFPIDPAFPSVKDDDYCSSFKVDETHPLFQSIYRPLSDKAIDRLLHRTRGPWKVFTDWIDSLYAR